MENSHCQTALTGKKLVKSTAIKFSNHLERTFEKISLLLTIHRALQKTSFL